MASHPLIFICYLAYLALALYKHHLGVASWEDVKDSRDERGRIRKTTLDLDLDEGKSAENVVA